MSQPATATSRSVRLSRDFEDLLRQGDADHFLRGVAAECGDTPDSPWEVLAVIDQLYRRGKIAPQLFRLARIGIERRALGFKERFDAGADMPGRAAPADPAAQSEPGQQQLRDELAQSRLEAEGYRQRVQQLEQQLQHLQRQALQELLQPATGQAQPPPEEAPQPQPESRPLESRSPVAKLDIPRRAVAPRGVRLAGIWVVACAIAVATLLALMHTGQLRAVRTAAPVAAVPDTQATSVAASTKPPPARSPGALSLQFDRYVVGSSDRQAVITVRRSGGTDGEIAMEWGASGGGAKSGRDYTAPVRATLKLADGQDSAQLVIPILRNAERRHTEFFEVTLVHVTDGAGLGGTRRATVFILPGAGR